MLNRILVLAEHQGPSNKPVAASAGVDSNKAMSGLIVVLDQNGFYDHTGTGGTC